MREDIVAEPVLEVLSYNNNLFNKLFEKIFHLNHRPCPNAPKGHNGGYLPKEGTEGGGSFKGSSL